MFALVSTVDSLGKNFPGHCVLVFRTEGDAYKFAAELLVTHDKQVERNGDHWLWPTAAGEAVTDSPEKYFTAASLVSDWQDALSPSEYFHVFPVADLPQTVRELFLDRDHESFVRSIEQMNQMYRLQVSTIPTLTFVDRTSSGEPDPIPSALRLHRFKSTLIDEVNEIDAIIRKADKKVDDEAQRESAIDVLTDVADLLADIVVFCVSEMRKFGLPPAAIMAIVMESNKSKLQPDGSAKYDDNGKFLKGPNYFPPEPKLKELITELLEGQNPLG